MQDWLRGGQRLHHLPTRPSAGQHRLVHLVLGDAGEFAEMTERDGDIGGRGRLRSRAGISDSGADLLR
jgi:hypothetical protein